MLQVASDRVGLVATSRPEGVTIERYADSFVVYDLKPLSDEQQAKAIREQIGEAAFFRHLMAFTRIRKEHDRIYCEVAFPSDEERARIEGFHAPNRLLLGDGTARDPEQRQRTRDGSGFVHVSREAAPQSAYLLALQPFFTNDVLRAFDSALSQLALSSDLPSNEDVQACVARLPDKGVQELIRAYGDGIFAREHDEVEVKTALAGEAIFAHMGLAVKLGLLAIKRQTKASTLWPRIMLRTDAIYVAIEDLLPVFKQVLEWLAAHLGAYDSIDLRFGNLKDPVRIHEKGIDDYASDFDDFDDDVVIPEACVLDVLRARAVCPSGELMLQMQEQLLTGFEVLINGTPTRIELLRSKSKFATGALDPTRFRNILNNIVLTYGSRRTFAELQVQQRDILAFNDAAHAHDHYNFFRSLFASRYTTELDKMLERTMLFLEEVAGVPVLLSMLVLLFDDGQVWADQLPTNRYELYNKAMQRVLSKRGADEHKALHVLRAIAMANLHAQARREFTSAHVRSAISDKAGLALWQQLEEEAQGVPLVKTLAAPVKGFFRGTPAQYQFRHLSFQEALCAQAIIGDERCRCTCAFV